ncbi:MAG: hypothetical protein ACRER8_06755 [Pseudomonas sp.]|uniref:hypothetical protein n=1 Tax=Pseudomonas sp. TaxID=306 RepID=UPI003D6FC9E3
MGMLLLEWACFEREANFTGGSQIKKLNELMMTIDAIDSAPQPLRNMARSAIAQRENR